MQTLRDWRLLWGQQARDSLLWQRWQQLQARERLALGLLALFLLAALLYLTLWQPASRQLQSARGFYESQRALHQYLLAHAEEAQQLAATPATLRLLPEQLSGAVTQSAQQHGLVLERVDNEGTAGVLVSLAQAPFESLLPWLLALQAQGVELSEVSLDRAANGRLDARLSLRVSE